MPNIKTAKDIAEGALKTIGAFPSSQTSADDGELRDTMVWLEMLLNYQSGIRPLAGFWQVFDIPLEGGVGDYDMSDYASDRGVSHIFSAFLVDQNGDTDPIEFMYENTALAEDLSETGRPCRATITRDKDMVLKVYPEPTQLHEDQGYVIRVRVQTYHDKIDKTGIGDEDIRLRPSWYLWLVKRLAYEIGGGPIRRLTEGELRRLEKDAMKLEKQLCARDGKENGPQPPVTEPMDLSVDCYYGKGYRRQGLGNRGNGGNGY